MTRQARKTELKTRPVRTDEMPASLPVEVVIPILKHLERLAAEDDQKRSGHISTLGRHALYHASLVSSSWAGAARSLLYTHLKLPEDGGRASQYQSIFEMDVAEDHGVEPPRGKDATFSATKGEQRLLKLLRTVKSWQATRAKMTEEETEAEVETEQADFPSIKSLDFSACYSTSGMGNATAFLALFSELFRVADLSKLTSLKLPYLPINNSPLPYGMSPVQVVQRTFAKVGKTLVDLDLGSRILDNNPRPVPGLFSALSTYVVSTMESACLKDGVQSPLKRLAGLTTHIPTALAGSPFQRTIPQLVDVTHFKNLESLEIVYGPVTDAFLHAIAAQGACNALRDLRIYSPFCAVTVVGITALCQGCPKLESLRVGGAHGDFFTERGIKALAESVVGPNLRTLDLSTVALSWYQHPSGFNPQSPLIGRSRPVHLEAPAFFALTRFANLRVLSLEHQQVTAGLLAEFIPSLVHLEALCIKGCDRLFGAPLDQLASSMLDGPYGLEAGVATHFGTFPRKLKILDIGRPDHARNEEQGGTISTGYFSPFSATAMGFSPPGLGLPLSTIDGTSSEFADLFATSQAAPYNLRGQAMLRALTAFPDLEILDPSFIMETLFPNPQPSTHGFSARMGPGPGPAFMAPATSHMFGQFDPVGTIDKLKTRDVERSQFLDCLAAALPKATIFVDQELVPKYWDVNNKLMVGPRATVLPRASGRPDFETLCTLGGVE